MYYDLYFADSVPIVLHLDTLRISGFLQYVTGYSDDHTRIDFTLDALEYPEDPPFDYGYCHIIAYTVSGITKQCDIFGAIA